MHCRNRCHVCMQGSYRMKVKMNAQVFVNLTVAYYHIARIDSTM